MTNPPFGEEIQFPSVPETGIPEDAGTLQAVLSGQRSLARFYSLLKAACSGDSGFLVQLLERDWERRFQELASEASEVLQSLGVTVQEDKLIPAPEALAGIAAEQAAVTPRELAAVLQAFTNRVLICHEIVPWKSETRGVFEHFRSSLEAEDAHLSLLELMVSLLPEAGG